MRKLLLEKDVICDHSTKKSSISGVETLLAFGSGPFLVAAKDGLESVEQDVNVLRLDDQWWTKTNGSLSTSTNHYSCMQTYTTHTHAYASVQR